MPPDVPAWVADAVFYQIFPDRFAASPRVVKPGPLEPWDAPPTPHGFKGGDLLGIVEHLDDLVELGVSALYLNPIFSSASNHRYHTYDYLSVDPLLGGNEALRELLDAAHARGIRVVLDGVFNHTGRGFWPFHHVLETGAASPYRRWFHFDQRRLDAGRPIVAYPSPRRRPEPPPDEPGPSPGDPERARAADPRGWAAFRRFGYRAWWGLPALPKLNTDEPAVREFLFGVAEHWVRFGIDGWRLDVPTEIDDPAFWREFRRRVRAANPEAYLVGEIWHEAPEWVAGDRFDGLMNYPIAKAILAFAGRDSLDRATLAFHPEYAALEPLDGPAFAREIERLARRYAEATTLGQLNLLDSHDTPRFVTLAGGDRSAVRLGFALLLTLPGAPSIYYGDEVGLAGGHDPDCRRAFPWDRSAWDEPLREWVRALVATRRARASLRRGRLAILASAGGAVAFARITRSQATVVAVNAGRSPARLELPVGPPLAAARALVPLPLPVGASSFAGQEGPGAPIGAREHRFLVELGPRSAALYAVD